MFANQCIVAHVLPTVTRTAPGYVQDYFDAAVGGNPSGDIGPMQQPFLVSGIAPGALTRSSETSSPRPAAAHYSPNRV
jgi:hypothetical protein